MSPSTISILPFQILFDLMKFIQTTLEKFSPFLNFTLTNIVKQMSKIYNVLQQLLNQTISPPKTPLSLSLSLSLYFSLSLSLYIYIYIIIIIIKSLLLVEHRASLKTFQTLRSPAIPLTSFHDFPVLLISSSVVLRHVLFGLPFFYIPEDSSLMRFCLLLLFLCVMCVQSNSIFLFLLDFLLTSVG